MEHSDWSSNSWGTLALNFQTNRGKPVVSEATDDINDHKAFLRFPNEACCLRWSASWWHPFFETFWHQKQTTQQTHGKKSERATFSQESQAFSIHIYFSQAHSRDQTTKVRGCSGRVDPFPKKIIKFGLSDRSVLEVMIFYFPIIFPIGSDIKSGVNWNWPAAPKPWYEIVDLSWILRRPLHMAKCAPATTATLPTRRPRRAQSGMEQCLWMMRRT